MIFEGENIRIDTYLANTTEYSRSKIEQALKDKQVLVNGKPVKKSYILKQNDEITLPVIK